VQADPETRLVIKFDAHARRVSLESGRALFRVARNRARPFLVRADGTLVRAIGTAFGVDKQRQGVVVTVAEGKVAVFPTDRVSPADAAPSADVAPQPARAIADVSSAQSTARSPKLAAPVQPARADTQLYLTAGQQITMPASGTAEPVRRVDSGRELAWADGRLVFEEETVAAIAEQFNRYNRVQLRVTDEVLASRRVSGVFNASEPESFIAFIQGMTAIRVERGDGEDITLAAQDTATTTDARR
jgi:transmembrane sensor